MAEGGARRLESTAGGGLGRPLGVPLPAYLASPAPALVLVPTPRTLEPTNCQVPMMSTSRTKAGDVQMELPEGWGRVAAAGRRERNTPTAPPGKASARKEAPSLVVAPSGRTVEASGGRGRPYGNPVRPSARDCTESACACVWSCRWSQTDWTMEVGAYSPTVEGVRASGDAGEDRSAACRAQHSTGDKGQETASEAEAWWRKCC